MGQMRGSGAAVDTGKAQQEAVVAASREQQLTVVLQEFTRTLVTDFPIEGILDQLVHWAVELLPVFSAGVTLISPGRNPHYVAASDPSARRFEELQTEIGEGPCVEAYLSGTSVAIQDLDQALDYPMFVPAARDAGLRAVFTFPLRHQQRRLGALDLYRKSPGTLDSWEMQTAQTLADVATAYLLNAQARMLAHQTSDRYRQSALHDPLTGLANRALLEERMEHASARGSRAKADLAVLFIDLDRFKRVNDVHGHQVGDALLVAVGDRLSRLLRPADTLARLSGDEFVVLCEDLAAPSDAQALAERVVTAMVQPFRLPEETVHITASVGIAFAGDSEHVPRRLLHNADRAMYQAKREGGDGHRVVGMGTDLPFFDDDLRADLRRALGADQLELFYQPVVRGLEGQLVGAEALLRWTHPIRGHVNTGDLVALAEHIGLIGDIGAWALERACHQAQRWLPALDDERAGRAPRPYIAVNVSSNQLMAYGFSRIVEGVLSRTGLDPRALVLEITEGILLGDGDRAAQVLVDLKALGVRVALDDFGSGYSSLQYLRTFAVDIVKVDQSFVADIGRDRAATAIVAAVTDLAHVLGLSVTAEGVETRVQRDAVVALGCDSLQGYYVAAPMNDVAFAAFVRQRQK